MKTTLLLIAVLAFPAAAIAQQYKWTDERGRVQYGDAPPPGVKATPLRSVPGPATQAAAKPDAKDKKGPMTPAEQDADFRKRQQESSKDREKQAQAAQQAEAKKENCQRAQEHLRTLESGQRISRTDSKGERYYLEDQQIAEEKTKARKMVQDWCG